MHPPPAHKASAAIRRGFIISRHRAGYTLVEMMIVVALVGILAASAITKLTSAVAERTKAAAYVLSSDLNYARSLAVTNNSNYQISFDITNNRYTLTHSGGNTLLDALPPSPHRKPGDPADEQIVRLSEMPFGGGEIELFSAYRLSPGAIAVGSVEFGPLGSTTLAEATTVWIAGGTGADRRYISVVIDPVTGLPEVGEMTAHQPEAP